MSREKIFIFVAYTVPNLVK